MYKVKIEKRVLRDMKSIPKSDQDKILSHIENLAENPFPEKTKQLKGRPGYRLRVGNYRIIYTVHNEELLVLVVKVGHRKDVYS